MPGTQSGSGTSGRSSSTRPPSPPPNRIRNTTRTTTIDDAEHDVEPERAAPTAGPSGAASTTSGGHPDEHQQDQRVGGQRRGGGEPERPHPPGHGVQVARQPGGRHGPGPAGATASTTATAAAAAKRTTTTTGATQAGSPPSSAAGRRSRSARRPRRRSALGRLVVVARSAGAEAVGRVGLVRLGRLVGVGTGSASADSLGASRRGGRRRASWAPRAPAACVDRRRGVAIDAPAVATAHSVGGRRGRRRVAAALVLRRRGTRACPCREPLVPGERDRAARRGSSASRRPAWSRPTRPSCRRTTTGPSRRRPAAC